MSIIITLLILLLIITIHELGHLFFAKKNKIDVPNFAIGFGPTIFKFTKNHTTYHLKLLPLGGYVQASENKVSHQDMILVKNASNKSKFWFYIGGVLFNFISAFIILIIIFFINGVTLNNNKIGQVINPSPASNANLKKSDVINKIKINDKEIKINRFQDLQNSKIIKAKKLVFNITRNNKKKEIIVNKKADQLIGIKPEISRNIFEIFKNAIMIVFETIFSIFKIFIDLIIFKVDMSSFMSPVGIAIYTNDAINQGYNFILLILNIFVSISLSIGVFNLLPVPPLDGGKLLFLALRSFFKIDKNEKIENIISLFFFALLTIFGLYVMSQDIINL